MTSYKSKNSKTKILKITFFIILSIAIFSMMYKIYGEIDVTTNENNYNIQKLQTIEEANENNKTIVKMLEDSTPTIVGISKIRNTGNTVFSSNGTNNLGIGSGVIISEKGYILTNEHVSGGKYSTCYITLETGDIQTATVVWSDSSLDLAIVKIKLDTINYSKLGNSDTINVGESVYAIGNPIGYEFQRTVTSGIISALNRTITFSEDNETIYMDNLIQTDATINPGNSGGPLLNVNGEVIGINTVKITSAEGIGFAVPINVIKPILESLEATGDFDEANIGIFAYDKNVIPYLYSGLKFDTGIYVAQISINSIAQNSDLKQGDIITKIDNLSLEKMSQLRQYIYTKKPGDEVKLTILRNKRIMEITMKLGKK